MPRLVHTEFGVTNEYPLGDSPVTVGRAAAHTIMTRDAMASRDHFRVDRAAGGYQVSDLGSRNGTRVNGRVIGGPTALATGDRITIGSAEFRFVGDPGDTAVDLPAATRPTRMSEAELFAALRQNRPFIEGAGRFLAFAGILVAAASPVPGMILFIFGLFLAAVGALL